MTKKDRKVQKRKKKLQQQQKSSRERIAISYDGGRMTAARQGTNKGYDVQTVRNFLEQLLFDLRVQHHENVKALNTLNALAKTDTMCQVFAATAELSPSIIDQMVVFQKKYASALLAANVIDMTDSTDEEVKEFSKRLLEANIERRNQEIGHLEALQNLFEEALLCAKVPFGFNQDGHPIGPQRVHRVQGKSEQSGIPDYDELLLQFVSHSMVVIDADNGWQSFLTIIDGNHQWHQWQALTD